MAKQTASTGRVLKPKKKGVAKKRPNKRSTNKKSRGQG